MSNDNFNTRPYLSLKDAQLKLLMKGQSAARALCIRPEAYVHGPSGRSTPAQVFIVNNANHGAASFVSRLRDQIKVEAQRFVSSPDKINGIEKFSMNAADMDIFAVVYQSEAKDGTLTIHETMFSIRNFKAEFQGVATMTVSCVVDIAEQLERDAKENPLKGLFDGLPPLPMMNFRCVTVPIDPESDEFKLNELAKSQSSLIAGRTDLFYRAINDLKRRDLGSMNDEGKIRTVRRILTHHWARICVTESAALEWASCVLSLKPVHDTAEDVAAQEQAAQVVDGPLVEGEVSQDLIDLQRRVDSLFAGLEILAVSQSYDDRGMVIGKALRKLMTDFDS